MVKGHVGRLPDELAADGISTEVIDLATLKPYDDETVTTPAPPRSPETKAMQRAIATRGLRNHRSRCNRLFLRSSGTWMSNPFVADAGVL